MSIYQSVRKYQRRSHWADFREIWYWGFSWKYVEQSQFGSYRKQISGILHDDLRMFCCCRRHELVIKYFVQHLTVTCNSTTHTEPIVAFPLQQWLLERPTMLRYTYIIMLRWSRGSVLAFGTQVSGFKPRRSRRIFRAKKSSARLPSEGK
jgi:hypothetical protein